MENKIVFTSIAEKRQIEQKKRNRKRGIIGITIIGLFFLIYIFWTRPSDSEIIKEIVRTTGTVLTLNASNQLPNMDKSESAMIYLMKSYKLAERKQKVDVELITLFNKTIEFTGKSIFEEKIFDANYNILNEKRAIDYYYSFFSESERKTLKELIMNK